jgi:hypothetical protein
MATALIKAPKTARKPGLVVINKNWLVRSTATEIRQALKMKKPSSYKIHKLIPPGSW